jgi:hypothetical protein
MAISLTRAEIIEILPKVERGLGKYLWLQERIAAGRDYHVDPDFRRRFNGFYRVRRATEWQDAFYALMARATGWPFSRVLEELSSATRRLEVSFASKLVASLDPMLPVIDSFVLKNLGLKLPPVGATQRARTACEVYTALCDSYSAFLHSDDGRMLVEEFRNRYPEARITELKMVDLVLWQKRA